MTNATKLCYDGININERPDSLEASGALIAKAHKDRTMVTLNTITQKLFKQQSPFIVGEYAEYEGLIAEVLSVGESPYIFDNREMIYVAGVYPEDHAYAGSRFAGYWPTGRFFSAVQ